MFTGIHVLEPALLDRLPAAGVSDVIADAYQPALDAGRASRPWITPATSRSTRPPRSYLAGNLALLRQPELAPLRPRAADRHRPRRPGARARATIRPPVRIAAGATIEADALVGPDVVVGPAGRVAAGARLERAVVWDGAVASGALADVVVTPEGVVQVDRSGL